MRERDASNAVIKDGGPGAEDRDERTQRPAQNSDLPEEARENDKKRGTFWEFRHNRCP